MRLFIFIMILGSGCAYANDDPCRQDIPGLGRFLLSRLPDREWIKTRLRPSDVRPGQVAAALRSPKWYRSPIFRGSLDQQAGVLRAALAAVEDGKLAPEQFASLVIRWSVFQDYSTNDIQMEPILGKSGRLTAHAREFFFGTWATRAQDLFGGTRHGAPPAVIKMFEGLIRKSPVSEQFIGIAKFEHASMSKQEEKVKGMLEEVIELAQTNREEDTDESSLGAMLVALDLKFGEQNRTTAITFTSFSAYQAFLNVIKPPESELTLYPVIGFSTHQHVLELMGRGGRDGALAFPGVKTLLEPDGVYRGRLGAFLHDFEHALITVSLGVPRSILNILPRVYRVLDVFAIASRMTSDIAFSGKVQLADVQLKIGDIHFGEKRGASLAQWIKWMVHEDQVILTHTRNKKQIQGPSTLAWVVVDMAMNPLVYEAAGFNLDEIIQSLGPDAVALFRNIRLNARESHYKEAWEIHRFLSNF